MRLDSLEVVVLGAEEEVEWGKVCEKVAPKLIENQGRLSGGEGYKS